MMKYRDIEYTVLQDIGRGVWKWSASVAGVVIMGEAAIKSQAVAAAEKAIDRALAALGFLSDSLAALVDMPSCRCIRRSKDCNPFFHNFIPCSSVFSSTLAARLLEIRSHILNRERGGSLPGVQA
jgi:hypothetical protein